MSGRADTQEQQLPSALALAALQVNGFHKPKGVSCTGRNCQSDVYITFHHSIFEVDVPSPLELIEE